uniref:Uncharacterized protein n=1 Tax=Chromera velia CCMP2878 TaxID=1169474 RepID=A0A0G4EZG8_9ALVE|eukprot:Cvel_14200.t1-p1 / transcript=Cvel_14200.t1 / gene=Cvel_14200 / organism=Chromera_velia_CCMP2878 / gene_product=hypothetical protein / transcript_product=hypothetical protein / location=Cvel_scaffold1001:9905-13144(+) / protein_length=210 / sequence_SO=supercontig / SO=protein_coding / is_pseudo=false
MSCSHRISGLLLRPSHPILSRASARSVSRPLSVKNRTTQSSSSSTFAKPGQGPKYGSPAPPRSAVVKAQQQPQAVQQQQQNLAPQVQQPGGWGTSIRGALVDGLAHGVGWGVASRLVDSVMGPRTMEVVHTHENSPPSNTDQQQPPSGDASGGGGAGADGGSQSDSGSQGWSWGSDGNERSDTSSWFGGGIDEGGDDDGGGDGGDWGDWD